MLRCLTYCSTQGTAWSILPKISDILTLGIFRTRRAENANLTIHEHLYSAKWCFGHLVVHDVMFLGSMKHDYLLGGRHSLRMIQRHRAHIDSFVRLLVIISLLGLLLYPKPTPHRAVLKTLEVLPESGDPCIVVSLRSSSIFLLLSLYSGNEMDPVSVWLSVF